MVIFIIAGLLFVMSAHQVIRYIYKRREPANVLFAILGFVAMWEILLESVHFPGMLFNDINYQDIERLQGVLKLILVPLYLYYLNYFFNNTMKRTFLRASLVVIFVFSVIQALSPSAYMQLLWMAFFSGNCVYCRIYNPVYNTEDQRE